VGRSPPNAPEVEVKVADFGMALLRGTTVIKGASAPYAHIVGTYPFMAPEQYWQVAADIRSDVYSLGCTLYCLLLGHPPFSPPQYTTPEQIMAAHRDTTVEPFLQRRPDVPESLEKLILAMLAKLPQQRCQTPGEVAAAMSSFIRGCDLAALLSRAMAAPHPARVGPPPGRHENQGTPPKEPDPNVKATPNPIRVEETVSYVKCPPIPVAPAEPPPAEPPPPRAEPSQQPPATVSQPHPPGFFKASDFASWARRRLAAAEPLPLDRRAWLSVLLAAGVLLGVWLIWMMCFRRAAAIDLLALAFAQGAQGENAWKWEDGALVSPEAPYSRFQIPQAPPRYFRLEIEESRVSPGGLLVVGLPYNGTQVTVPLDVPSIVADVEEDGSSRKEVADAAARFRFSGGPSKTHTCIVSSQGILAAYENQVTWVWISGRPLPRLDVQWRAAESGRLFLGTHYSPHRFTRLSLTPLYSHVGDSWAILLHGSEPFPSE
jgi:hypothetical protein